MRRRCNRRLISHTTTPRHLVNINNKESKQRRSVIAEKAPCIRARCKKDDSGPSPGSDSSLGLYLRSASLRGDGALKRQHITFATHVVATPIIRPRLPTDSTPSALWGILDGPVRFLPVRPKRYFG